VFLIAAPSWAVNAIRPTNVLDAPLRVLTSDDISPLFGQWISTIEEEDVSNVREALSFLLVYFDTLLDEHATKAQREAVIVTATNGMTPRQLILWANTLTIESSRVAIAKDQNAMNERSVTSGSAKLRIQAAKGNIIKALTVIHRYSLKP
jgi:hypothetical protein